MEILENLRELIGENFESVAEEINIAFETDEEVIVNNSQNDEYDKIAYINSEESKQYLFKLENEIITDVWEA